MNLFGLFKKKSSETEDKAPPNYTNLHAASEADGQLTLMLSNPDTGAATPFPPINILLRDAADLEQTKQTLRNAGAQDADFPVAQTIADGVVEMLGLDTGQSFTIMSESGLKQEGLTYEMARKGAMVRLRLAARDLDVEGGGGRFRAKYHDDLDLSASFMLIPEDWLDLNDIEGAPVFAVGTRISIHVCGSADTESVEGMQQIAEVMYRESVESPHENGKPLTPKLLTIRDGQIVPFEV